MSPNFPRLLCALLCAGAAAYGQSSFSGYVTEAGTPEHFQLNGAPVVCSLNAARCTQHTFGEQLSLKGKWDELGQTFKIRSFNAPNIHVKQAQIISGLAVIDKLLAPDLVRADGYALRLTKDTERDWNAPLTSATPIALHQWIAYSGTQGSDGVIALKWAVFSTSNITEAEKKLRQKTEFEPSTVTEDKRQGWASKSFKGIDYRRIPAAKNPEQQSRLERIGDLLVPAAQHELPADDPARIHFRFQLVNVHWLEAYGLASGIILVPEAVALQLNDDELAAVVANSMAGVMEKQQARYAPTFTNLGAADIASAIGGIFVPGLGLAPVGTGIASSKIQKRLEQQECRISLTLLADAGFHINQAPIAWWKLETRDHEQSFSMPVPRRTEYLFSILSAEWGPQSSLREPESLAPKSQ